MVKITNNTTFIGVCLWVRVTSPTLSDGDTPHWDQTVLLPLVGAIRRKHHLHTSDQHLVLQLSYRHGRGDLQGHRDGALWLSILHSNPQPTQQKKVKGQIPINQQLGNPRIRIPGWWIPDAVLWISLAADADRHRDRQLGQLPAQPHRFLGVPAAEGFAQGGGELLRCRDTHARSWLPRTHTHAHESRISCWIVWSPLNLEAEQRSNQNLTPPSEWNKPTADSPSQTHLMLQTKSKHWIWSSPFFRSPLRVALDAITTPEPKVEWRGLDDRVAAGHSTHDRPKIPKKLLLQQNLLMNRPHHSDWLPPSLQNEASSADGQQKVKPLKPRKRFF